MNQHESFLITPGNALSLYSSDNKSTLSTTLAAASINVKTQLKHPKIIE